MASRPLRPFASSTARARRRSSARPETAIERLEARMLLSAATPAVGGPTATDLSFHHEPGAVVTEIFLGYDSEGRWTDVEIVDPPQVGWLESHPHMGSKGFTYHPPEGFDGTVTFTYQVRDGAAVSGHATVTIVFDAPPALVAEPLYLTGESGSPVAGRLSGRFADGRAADAFHEIVTPPQVGTLALNESTGDFVYTPPSGFTGTVTFRHVIWVGTFSQPATVTIVIEPVGQSQPAPSRTGHTTGAGSDSARPVDPTFGGSVHGKKDRLSRDQGDAVRPRLSSLAASIRGADLLKQIAHARGQASHQAPSERKHEAHHVGFDRQSGPTSDVRRDHAALFELDWTALWDGHELVTLTGALRGE